MVRKIVRFALGLVVVTVVLFLGPPSSGMASAQSDLDKRYEDEWMTDGEIETGQTSSPGKERFNPFIQIDDWKVKAGVFAASAVILYFIWWTVFRIFLSPNRSPRAIFRYSFMGYLLCLYIAAFFCFSEYALVQAYDPALPYLPQLHLAALFICSGIWLMLAFLMTYFLEGKHN